MPKGSPFGPNLRALVIYLRFTQGIAFERLATLLSDLLGLDISEGALVNILDAAKDAFAKATAATPGFHRRFGRMKFFNLGVARFPSQCHDTRES